MICRSDGSHFGPPVNCQSRTGFHSHHSQRGETVDRVNDAIWEIIRHRWHAVASEIQMPIMHSTAHIVTCVGIRTTIVTESTHTFVLQLLQ